MKHLPLHYLLSVFFALVRPGALFAQPSDTINVWLDEVTLNEYRNISAISGSMASGIRIDSRMMETYPKLFGYTDPMRYLQSLPGVSTNADQSGGLHVQGGETSHNLLMVSDVPVYGSVNFTGLFSMFNQDHLPKVEFCTSSKSTFLGAQLSLDHTDTIPQKLSGTASLGLISGQATIQAPFSKRTSLTVSLRRSFINTFYGPLLKYDDSPLRYGFTDSNLTLLHRIDNRNTIDFNLLLIRDHGECIFGQEKIATDFIWGNTLSSVRWRHDGPKVSSSTSLFLTRYYIDCDLDNALLRGDMKAHITNPGIKTAIKLPYEINLEAEANLYHILPQDPQVPSNISGSAAQPTQQAFLGNIIIGKRFNIGHKLGITPNLLMSAYNEKGQYECLNIDPTVSIEYDMFRYGMLSFESGIRHQYISQTGMTNLGLPIEFWVAAGRYFKPQKSVYATLSYDVELFNSQNKLSFQIYGKRLYNQVEYTGFVYDFLTRPYRLEDNLVICSGYNYGLNIMLVKQAGSATGWLSYSYGQSLREGDGVRFPQLFHSSHERSHEMNAVMSYKKGRFDLGCNFILASGCPFTPANNLYLLSNSLFIFYDSYNSANLPPYMRLDLSATYNLPKRGSFSHSLNLSVFNATAHKNYTMGYIAADQDKEVIRYKLAKLIIPVIPSISYSCRF
ncbi:MAG: TonB-dependent receptor [Bacteroidaceae bacterium]|nr:TonB-dependent receptor [Bacteroidaceae bacterium]